MSSQWLPSDVLAHDLAAGSIAAEAEREKWGWSEAFVAMLLLGNVLLFVPGAQSYRTVVRAMPYVLSGAALAYYFRQGGDERMPGSAKWLLASFVLLLLNLLHETAQPWAGAAQIVFQICISAPAFWMARSIRGEAQIRRVVWVVFLGSAIGSVVGVLQVYFPQRFMPPEFSLLARSLNPEIIHSLTYIGADGREIIRPPGLSDLPGGAAVAGMMTMVLGLALALGRNERWFVRGACAAAAVVGMTALYLTHVRSLTLVAAASVGLFALMRIRQGRTLEGGATLAVGAALVAGSYLWALAVGGEAVSDRFSGLANEDVLRVFGDQRGSFIRYTLSETLYEFPLGAGLGRWGMMQVYFGDPTLWQAPPIHVEVQLTGWLLDGGVPLWLVYGGALVAALVFTYRTSVRAETHEIEDIATIALCLQLTILCLCLTGPVFNTQLGILFWGITGGLFGAVRGSTAQNRNEFHDAAEDYE
jgi:hypothetical protein